ncbi:MAG: BON domain-containing protein [Gammaproteobacteria bacterium]
MKSRLSMMLLLTLSISCLGGCTAILIGGAAAGGYAVGKDERSAKQILDDSAVTASIKTRYAADKYVRALSINIDTYDGVVTLNGKVGSYIEQQRAEDIASDIVGVKSVINKLELRKPPPAGG